jgi:hypothetical protein
MTKSALERLNERLVDAYVSARRLYQPKFMRTGALDKLLEPAAKRLQEMGGSPELYIDFLMDALPIGIILYPEGVYSVKMLNAYEKAVCREDVVRRIKLQNSALHIKQELKLGRSLKEILGDNELNIHPIMAYVIADANGDKELVEKYKPVALDIVRRDPRYWDILQEILHANNPR